jgi:hypothetical protein
MRHSLVFAVMILGALNIHPDAKAQSPAAFVCVFSLGVTSTYSQGWKSERNKDRLEFTFAALDEGKGTAQFIGNAGASTVHFVKGRFTWNFVEVTPAGNITSTTVFAADEGNLPAVHSRHPALAKGNPVVSQYLGTCSPRS